MKATSGNCQKMAECIQKYCSASGQKLILEKSSIVFSMNVPNSLRREIEKKLGIKAIGNPSTYLGIPLF